MLAGVRRVAADYFELTKPKVQSLLLFTTVATMEVAGNPPASRIVLTCLGGYLSAGGAGAVNHYWDRDLDAQMKRTAGRPVPAGRIAPRNALIFGFVLAALSFVELSLWVNVLSASLALTGFVGYVGVYTIWLKRRTPYNIVIGGAAGAIPPLVGWAATRGSVSWTAVYLFVIVFYWTPPHLLHLLPYICSEEHGALQTRHLLLLHRIDVRYDMYFPLGACAGISTLLVSSIGPFFNGQLKSTLPIWSQRSPSVLISVIMPYLTWRRTLAPGSTSLAKVPAAVMERLAPGVGIGERGRRSRSRGCRRLGRRSTRENVRMEGARGARGHKIGSPHCQRVVSWYR